MTGPSRMPSDDTEFGQTSAVVRQAKVEIPSKDKIRGSGRFKKMSAMSAFSSLSLVGARAESSKILPSKLWPGPLSKPSLVRSKSDETEETGPGSLAGFTSSSSSCFPSDDEDLYHANEAPSDEAIEQRLRDEIQMQMSTCEQMDRLILQKTLIVASRMEAENMVGALLTMKQILKHKQRKESSLRIMKKCRDVQRKLNRAMKTKGDNEQKRLLCECQSRLEFILQSDRSLLAEGVCTDDAILELARTHIQEFSHTLDGTSIAAASGRNRSTTPFGARVDI